MFYVVRQNPAIITSGPNLAGLAFGETSTHDSVDSSPIFSYRLFLIDTQSILSYSYDVFQNCFKYNEQYVDFVDSGLNSKL